MLSVALFDVSGTIAFLPEGERRARLHSKLPTPLTEGLTPQDLSESYSPRDWQDVFYGDQPGLNALNQSQDTPHVPTDTFGALDPEQQSEILNSWRHAITTEPKAYLSHRLAAFDWVLAFRKTLWQPVLFDPANYSEEMQRIVPPISEQTLLQKELSLLFNKLAYFPPYKPWLCFGSGDDLARRFVVQTSWSWAGDSPFACRSCTFIRFVFVGRRHRTFAIRTLSFCSLG